MQRFAGVLTMLLILPVWAVSQTSDQAPLKDRHPDLSGLWAYIIALPPTALKREVNGTAIVEKLPQGIAARGDVEGALPFTKTPSYKPEFQAKVADLYNHESKLDPVFYCAKPGIPRIGPPRRIMQTAKEMVFFYEDVSGDPYRIIPVVAKSEVAAKHRPNADPSDYGDSVAYWDGNALVVDVTNFNDDTWFGEGGYFHTDAMHVTERLWRVGDNLAYQVTVADPKVLAAPWTMPARVVKPSTEPLEESPRCVEDDGHRLLNNDHHLQR